MTVTLFKYKVLIYISIALLTIIQFSYSTRNEKFILPPIDQQFPVTFWQRNILFDSNIRGYNPQDSDQQQFVLYILKNTYTPVVWQKMCVSSTHREELQSFLMCNNQDNINSYNVISCQQYFRILMDLPASLNNYNINWNLLSTGESIPSCKNYIRTIYDDLNKILDGIQNTQKRTLQHRLHNISNDETDWCNVLFQSNPLENEHIRSYVIRNLNKGLIPVFDPDDFAAIYQTTYKNDFDFDDMAENMSNALFVMSIISMSQSDDTSKIQFLKRRLSREILHKRIHN